ncbi:MAG: GNAT family N-acetyltransferase [Oscillatoria sp. SIO1A7]|nr:GNAT family N-acetyltransferase [Oscillatoria sp. SIO1A7]
MSELKITIRESLPEEDSLLAEHLYRLWRDNNIPADQIRSNWLEIAIQFIDTARRDLCYRAFVAEVEGTVVGSAGCQLFAGLYPDVLVEDCRRFGYIWGVYVEPDYRRRGIATQLMLEAIAYLKSIGCTRALLHASPFGKPVYDRLGFIDSNEMRLGL